jgi:hypothetical protein
MFLTREEVRELTGYKRKTDQCRFLRDNRYPFELDKDGYPKVPRMVVETRFQVKSGGPKLRLA